MSLHDDKRLVDGAKRLFANGRSFPWNLVSTRLTQFPYFDELLGHPGLERPQDPRFWRQCRHISRQRGRQREP